MEQIRIFNHEMFGAIRTMNNERGETFFVGKDVAEALGYKNPSNALQIHVDNEDKTSYLIQVSGSNYKANTVFVNESGGRWRGVGFPPRCCFLPHHTEKSPESFAY